MSGHAETIYIPQNKLAHNWYGLSTECSVKLMVKFNDQGFTHARTLTCNVLQANLKWHLKIMIRGRQKACAQNQRLYSELRAMFNFEYVCRPTPQLHTTLLRPLTNPKIHRWKDLMRQMSDCVVMTPCFTDQAATVTSHSSELQSTGFHPLVLFTCRTLLWWCL